MILIVTLPRFRSTLTARICLAMGAKLIYDNNLNSVNEGGDYESVQTAHGVNSLEFSENEALKIMAGAFLFESNIQPTDKIIICLRSPSGMSESQSKIGMWSHDDEVRRMNYWRLMTQVKNWINSHSNPIYVLDTDELVSNPIKQISALGNFLGNKIIPEAAFNIIDQAKVTLPPSEKMDDAFKIYANFKPIALMHFNHYDLSE